MDGQLAAFDGRSGRKICHLFKRFDELWTAIRVAGVVHRINANENVLHIEHFSPGETQRQEDRVAGRHIGDRYALRWCFRNRDVPVGQRRSAELRQIYFNDAMFRYLKTRSNATCCIEFNCVGLTIVERQCIYLMTLLVCQRGNRR